MWERIKRIKEWFKARFQRRHKGSTAMPKQDSSLTNSTPGEETTETLSQQTPVTSTPTHPYPQAKNSMPILYRLISTQEVNYKKWLNELTEYELPNDVASFKEKVLWLDGVQKDYQHSMQQAITNGQQTLTTINDADWQEFYSSIFNNHHWQDQLNYIYVQTLLTGLLLKSEKQLAQIIKDFSENPELFSTTNYQEQLKQLEQQYQEYYLSQLKELSPLAKIAFDSPERLKQIEEYKNTLKLNHQLARQHLSTEKYQRILFQKVSPTTSPNITDSEQDKVINILKRYSQRELAHIPKTESQLSQIAEIANNEHNFKNYYWEHRLLPQAIQNSVRKNLERWQSLPNPIGSAAKEKFQEITGEIARSTFASNLMKWVAQVFSISIRRNTRDKQAAQAPSRKHRSHALFKEEPGANKSNLEKNSYHSVISYASSSQQLVTRKNTPHILTVNEMLPNNQEKALLRVEPEFSAEEALCLQTTYQSLMYTKGFLHCIERELDFYERRAAETEIEIEQLRAKINENGERIEKCEKIAEKQAKRANEQAEMVDKLRRDFEQNIRQFNESLQQLALKNNLFNQNQTVAANPSPVFLSTETPNRFTQTTFLSK